MTTGSDAAAIRKSAESHYREGEPIWNPADHWNSYKRHRIDEFVRTMCGDLLSSAGSVLNAGSGGDAYDWLPPATFNIDLFEAQVRKLSSLAVVGDIQQAPFRSSAFDMIVCVGSVLNYVSAMETLSEMNRLLMHNGHVVLHYETSDSFEHLGSSHWRRDVARVETFNSGSKDTLWVYSRSFIESAIARMGWKIIASDGFHILSPLGARLGFPPRIAATWAKADRFSESLRRFADDEIILAVKTA